MIGAIALVVIVVGCLATIVTNANGLPSLLLAALGLLVILAVFWLAHRFVAALPDQPGAKPPAEPAELAANDAWELEHPRPTDRTVNGVCPTSLRERFGLGFVPGALGGAVVVLAVTLFFIYADNTPHPAGQMSLNDVGQLLWLCMLPLSLLGGAWLGLLSASNARGIAVGMGVRGRTLDVITVIVAGVTGMLAAVVVGAFSLLAIIM